MRARGFDVELAEIVAGSADVPTRFNAGVYLDALLGPSGSFATDPTFDDQGRLSDMIESGEYDDRYGCEALARYRSDYLEFRDVVANLPDVEPVDPREDPEVQVILAQWRQCAAAEGVEESYESPDEMILDLNYLDYLASRSESNEESKSSAGGNLSPLPTPEPLSAEEQQERATLRAADYACSAAFYGGVAERINKLQEGG